MSLAIQGDRSNESILEGHSPEPAHLNETAGFSGRGIAYAGVGSWRKYSAPAEFERVTVSSDAASISSAAKLYRMNQRVKPSRNRKLVLDSTVTL